MFEDNSKHKPSKQSKFSNKRKETVTRTFRIREDYDKVLRKEAEKQGISVNTLMNLILRKYVRFDRFCRNTNSISLTKQAFRGILEVIPSERLALAAENIGSKDIQYVIDMMGLPSNYDSFVYLVTKSFGGPDCAMWFTCYRHPHGNYELLHLQHNLGREWSVYLQKYFLSYLKTLKIDGETNIYDYAVNIKVPIKHQPLKARNSA